MAELHEFKCPCCGGAIEFDSGLQRMKCPYCGSDFEMESLKSYQEVQANQPQDNMTWETTAGTEWAQGETDGLRTDCCTS